MRVERMIRTLYYVDEESDSDDDGRVLARRMKMETCVFSFSFKKNNFLLRSS